MRWVSLILLAACGPLMAQDTGWPIYEARHVFSRDAALVDYIERVAHKLAPGTPIGVVQDGDVRAASWPSGKVYVTVALIARAPNEAALAGVIAHEIAHRTMPVSRSPLVGNSESGVCARFAAVHALTPPPDGERERERAADEAAQKMLLAAGYDPSAMVEFFSRLRREDPGLPKSFSAEDLLLEKLQLEADLPRAKNLVLNTSEFERVHGRVQ